MSKDTALHGEVKEKNMENSFSYVNSLSSSESPSTPILILQAILLRFSVFPTNSF